ncbi:MAG: hypothetical protein GOMPHAMPRED_001984 [Gomphillus americanus]|uniref:Uncharacterized protein n=1 Tax=Gomphillus americanus TaxID=1940652 RepID=A0A8H3F7L3_9LECA|nr:MAG: hypothetical protein GOMPHAMPRED_001984 [Gomphillus americanus]
MARNTSSSGTSTTVLSKQTTNDGNQMTKRPQLRKNGPSGNSVTFAGEEGEQDIQQDVITPTSISFNNMRSSSFSSTKAKLRPLRSKKSSDTPGLDLSKSMAENEVFAQVHRLEHTRSSSGYSTGSVNNRSGVQYRYIQTNSRSRADSGEDLTLYAHFTKTPPPLHIRTHSSSSNPRIKSPSQTHLDYPPSASSLRGEVIYAESMGRSGRSSFDSVFRRRARGNTETDPVAAAAIVREEWFARQAAKQRKREEEEARLRERAERRQEKVNVNGRPRADTVTTIASSEKGSTLSAIRYTNTRPGLPVDKELEYIRAGIRPPTATRSVTSTTIKEKAKGTKNGFEKFFYNLYTAWLKFLHQIGIKRS